MQHNRRESGQAVILVLIGLSLFLLGAIGLAIDGSQMYAQRQMAQVAADAAAQAGIMSIFDGTNTGSNSYGGASFTCTSTDVRTPCVYASRNGFSTNADAVAVDFPTAASMPWVTLSSSDPVNLIRVTITRTVKTSLIRFVGPSTTTVKAMAVAGIVSVFSTAPIVVTHPSLSGALSTNGNPTIRICGGPPLSIEVNSSSASAFSMNSNTTVDLSRAGPADPGNCTTGTGGDFGVWGRPTSPSFNFLKGSTGDFVQPSSPVLDPLADVPVPARPTSSSATAPLGNGTFGCPPSPFKPCKLYFPGLYTGGINIQNETAVFKPGIYYIEGGGFKNRANAQMYMSSGFPDDAVTGQGMLVYNTGTSSDDALDIGANSNATLVGTPTASIYKGILFFEDRNAPAANHTLGGGGNVSLTGTLYIANTLAIMKGNASHHQTLSLQGNSGSTTLIIGEIIVNALSMGGNPSITMRLNPNPSANVRQVALVK